ncbi:tetratricopeptide repeat protein 8 [Ceratitis capitata]|uniref:tetratricopeptide repeat protein 8 n=1 Tax=Ceratitis capitata TaxID=7213 RepID=UPI0006189364|nr:tetratricopeptide repeat protein 8 [Ceratitis capitata]
MRADGKMMTATPLAPLAPLASLPSTRMMIGTANSMSMLTTSASANTATAVASLSMQQRHSQFPTEAQTSKSQKEPQPAIQLPTPTLTIAALEWQYFQAVSLFRRRKYEKCVEVCNGMLRTGHETNVQMFTSTLSSSSSKSSGEKYEADAQYSWGGGGGGVGGGSNNLNIANSSRHGRGHNQNLKYNNNNSTNNSNVNGNNNKVSMPTWMMEGVWQLKMRALTQRVYIDDLETDDAFEGENEEVELERIATAARPGTSIKTAFIPRPSTSTRRANSTASSKNGLSLSEGSRTTTAQSNKSIRPKSGMVRPGTATSRPGSSVGHRGPSRCGTASRIRATSAAAYTVGDVTAKLYQASRLNPTIYAEREALIKALFQFLYYHESDVQKAYSLCEAVMEVHKQKRSSGSAAAGAPVDWWWDQQIGRCLLILRLPRKAETFLVQSLAVFPHPDTFLLLSRLYQRLNEPERALELIGMAVDRHPFNVTFRAEQGRIFDALSKPDDAVQIYRLITKLNPIHVEALASIALNHFYDGNPEMALMYYRRILSLGTHSAELYCNIALCCLYGGQIDLVLPCFQRALLLSKTAEQKADIWYNLSFVALSTGDFHLARRCLQLCLTADACSGATLNNLAVLAAHSGDLMRAKSYLQAAKEVLANSSEIDSNMEYMQAHYKL